MPCRVAYRTAIAVAAASLLVAGACDKRSRTRNSAASSSVVEEDVIGTATRVYRFKDVRKSLNDARKAADEERWDESLAAAESLLKEQPAHAVAQTIRDQALLELPNQKRYVDFAKAANANDVGAAFRLYLRISDDSRYKERARPIYDTLRTRFVENQIDDAREKARAGRCDDARRIARIAGERFPEVRERLDRAAAACRPARGAPIAAAPLPATEPAKAAEPEKAPPAIATAAPPPPANLSPVTSSPPVLVSQSYSGTLAAAPIGTTAATLPAARPAPAAVPPSGPRISEAERKKLVRVYLQESVQPRVTRKYSYPRAAQLDGVEGAVKVQLTVSSRGALLGAKVVGACPAKILCDAALETVRSAAPFGAAVASLGEKLDVIVNLDYTPEK